MEILHRFPPNVLWVQVPAPESGDLRCTLLDALGQIRLPCGQQLPFLLWGVGPDHGALTWMKVHRLYRLLLTLSQSSSWGKRLLELSTRQRVSGRSVVVPRAPKCRKPSLV